MEEPWYEDEYFVDSEIALGEIVLSPENTFVHVFQPHCWDSVEVDTGEGIVDVILQGFVIQAMIKSGYMWRDNGHPSDGYKNWFVFELTRHLDEEIVEFYESLT